MMDAVAPVILCDHVAAASRLIRKLRYHGRVRESVMRGLAGETRRSEVEALDPENLPWPTSMIAEKKGLKPGTPFIRIWSKPTGLLDLKGLEEAIERIRHREG